MNDNEFELGKSGWFEVKVSEANDFINENLTSEEYGLYYSVGFVGSAETYLWQTKSPPVVGEKYYGSLELAKSGKSTKFKWDKKNAPSHTPDGKPTPQARQDNAKGNTITLSMVWKTVAGIRGLPENDEDFAKFFEIVNSHLTELVLMSEKLNEPVKGDGDV
jgi:hypothetical protein